MQLRSYSIYFQGKTLQWLRKCSQSDFWKLIINFVLHDAPIFMSTSVPVGSFPRNVPIWMKLPEDFDGQLAHDYRQRNGYGEGMRVFSNL